MPFVKVNKVVVWKPSTPDDVSLIRKSIFEVPLTGEVLSLSPEMKDRISTTVGTLLTQYKTNFVEESNVKLYSGLSNFLSKAQHRVDIVMPVYNAGHIVKECIQHVLDNTQWPYKLIIVDDASDMKTAQMLQTYWIDHPDKISLVRNTKNRGFAASVNRGIKSGDGHYVVLLNSDILVTPRWLTKMIMALEAEPRNQIVNPATNNTADINIPMSPGCSYTRMNEVFETFSLRRYPEIMPTGFCFLFRRELIKKIGLFDESYGSYGEETDFWMKTISFVENANYPKYRAIMADDTYLYHERESSFSALGKTAHMGQRRNSSERFHKLWPGFRHWRQVYDVKKALGRLRDPIPPAVILRNKPAYRVCWVVHSTAFCGAMKYIADVVNELIERGIDAKVALIMRNPEGAVDVLNELRTAPVVFKSNEEFIRAFNVAVFNRGYVIASTSELAFLVKELADRNPNLTPALHTQSYEPALTKDVNAQEQMKEGFKFFPVVSSSNWITKTLKDELKVEPFATVTPGVNQFLFYPRGRAGDDRPTVMIPAIKSYWFKGYDRAVALCKELLELSTKKDKEIRILVYGTDIFEVPGVTALGPLLQGRLAELLGKEVDVFVDPAYCHSYGMPAIEALASGVEVVSWDNKGIHEYIKHGHTGVLFPKKTEAKEIAAKVFELLTKPEKRLLPSNHELWALTLKENDRETSVRTFISAFEKRFELSAKKRSIVFVTPHLRKHGGPTTIMAIADGLAKLGHNVSITTIHSDINPEVASRTNLPININPQVIPQCDVIISNSDNEMNDVFATTPNAKKHVMLKMSHNPRFKQLEDDGLKLPWDAIVTTTEWLKNVCENPLPDWTHPAVKARRIGWFHYGHEEMKTLPSSRSYGDGEAQPIVIGTLVHKHSLKGTQVAVNALAQLKAKFGNKIVAVGVGEVSKEEFKHPAWLEYVMSPSRDQMALTLSKIDIWIGASFTEGLGRMALEAMSAGCACVLGDTNAEFAKDKENCIVVPTGDPQAIVDAVSELVNHRELRNQIIMSGFKTAEDASDSTACIRNLEQVIEELFNE